MIKSGWGVRPWALSPKREAEAQASSLLSGQGKDALIVEALPFPRGCACVRVSEAMQGGVAAHPEASV